MRKFSGSEAHLAILQDALQRRSSRRWNAWRGRAPRVVPDLRGVALPGVSLRGFDLGRARLDEAVLGRADLAGARLEKASLARAYLPLANLTSVRAGGADLTGARLTGATLRQGDFRRAACLEGTTFQHANLRLADFRRARMAGAELSEADLTEARFDGADLAGATLGSAVLDGTSFAGANLRGAGIWGAFIRRVVTDKATDQKGLGVDVSVAWDAHPGNVVTFTEVDDIRLAAVHDFLGEHGSVTSLISAGARRVVLILGRFLPRRKRVLNRLAAALRERGKAPILFDFPGPEDREISDTVRFIAGMSQFIVVDLTDASSVPLELQATIPDLMVPVLPIVQAGRPMFSMFSDLQRRYFWIRPPVSYRDADELVRHVDAAILARAQAAAGEIRQRRAEAVRRPVSVARAGKA